MAFAADRVIRFIAADLNLLAAVDRLAVLDPQRHDCFAFAEPADGLHLLNLVGVDQHIFAALEQIVLKIILQTEGHHRDSQFVHNPHQLENAVLAQELAFVDQHAVGLRQTIFDDAVHICILINWNGLLAQSDPGGDISHFIPVIDGRRKEQHGLALLFIIMGNFENLNGFAAVHCPILKK